MSSQLFIAQGKGNTTSSITARRSTREQRCAGTLLRDSTAGLSSAAPAPIHYQTQTTSSKPTPGPLYHSLSSPGAEMLGKEVLIRESSPDPEQNSSAWDCSQNNKTTACKQHNASVWLLCCQKKPLPFDLTITPAQGGTVFGPQRAH